MYWMSVPSGVGTPTAAPVAGVLATSSGSEPAPSGPKTTGSFRMPLFAPLLPKKSLMLKFGSAARA